MVLKTERLLKMTLEERRKEYLRDYVSLKEIPAWMEEMKSKTQSDGKITSKNVKLHICSRRQVLCVYSYKVHNSNFLFCARLTSSFSVLWAPELSKGLRLCQTLKLLCTSFNIDAYH